MTRHLSQEERIDEILNAALSEASENGTANLTMEAIVARTSLSKGGVYRFFANKREVLLGLFAFFYAALHLSVYLGLDQGFAWSFILEDVVERPFITVGFASFLLL